MEKFIEDLFDILKINTVYNTDELPFGSGNKKCLNLMLDKGLKDGFKVKNIENYCGYIEYGEGSELLGVLCHIDVVDANPIKWRTNPFIPEIIDNKIYARGIQDDKGPLMASFYALKELKEEGFKPNKRVRLIMGCNEETGSLCMEKYKEVEEEPTIAFSPDAEYPVIFGEKGRLVIKISGKIDSVIKEFHAHQAYNIVPPYAIVFIDKKYEYFGKAGHAMNPKLGISAIDLAIDDLKEKYNDKFIDFLDKYFTHDTDGIKTGVNAADIVMGELTSNFAVMDIKDNKLEMYFDYRIPFNECKELILCKLRDIVKNFNLNVECISYNELHLVKEDSFLVQSLLKAYQKNTNDYVSKPITIGGGTYAKCFKNAVAFGTKFIDDEEVCHIDNEYVDIDKLKLNIKIIKDAIKELTK